MKIGKIQMAREILEAMNFLSIPSDKYGELIFEYKTIENLHNEMSNRLN